MITAADAVTRVLVTGSRIWWDGMLVWAALNSQRQAHPFGPFVVVHGGARGADTHADAWALAAEDPEITSEVHPARWELYGRRAGAMRSLDMVNAGATVCLAFYRGESRGTKITAEAARRRGIKVIPYGEVLINHDALPLRTRP